VIFFVFNCLNSLLSIMINKVGTIVVNSRSIKTIAKNAKEWDTSLCETNNSF